MKLKFYFVLSCDVENDLNPSGAKSCVLINQRTIRELKLAGFVESYTVKK